MRRLGPTLFLGLVAGCSAAVTAPAAIQPTLRAVEGLGYRCEPGEPDNVPSGLTQWRCPGAVAGAAAGINVDGNETGVSGMALVVSSVDVGVTRAEFQRVARAVPPLSGNPNLVNALDSWGGNPGPTQIAGVRINGLCDATQCIVFIGFVEGPTQPPPVP